MQGLNQILTCKKCKKYFSEPVILPCKKSICKSHIYESKSDIKIFRCEFCKNQHEIPENGFLLNETTNDILNLKLHLNEKTRGAHDMINEFDNIIGELKLLYNDPQNFIFDYISSTRNKIDLNREIFLQKINCLSEQMLMQLKQFEEECKMNLNSLNSFAEMNLIELSEYNKISSNWKEEFRKPDISEERIQDFLNEMSQLIKVNRDKSIDFKHNLLKGRGCFFIDKKFDFGINHFGYLKFDNFRNTVLFDDYNEKGLLNSSILEPCQSVELIKLCEFDWKTKFSLIYRATLDGFEAYNFHKKCNNIPKTLTIIRVENTQNVFGGFTQSVWDNNNVYKEDNNAFIFSLINQDAMPIKMNYSQKNGINYSIRCNLTFGPTFGAGFDFFISSHSNISMGSYSNLGYSYLHPRYQYGSEEAKNFLAGSYKFFVKEIEVYRVN